MRAYAVVARATFKMMDVHVRADYRKTLLVDRPPTDRSISDARKWNCRRSLPAEMALTRCRGRYEFFQTRIGRFAEGTIRRNPP